MSSSLHASKPFPVANLLAEADIVVVGAGYVGASVVHHLIEECVRANRPIPSILILEAREACSGATGRNDPLLRAASLLETHGKAVAEQVASFEARQVDSIKELVAREHIDCDFEETRVVDVCLYPECRNKMGAKIEKIAEAGISTAKMIKYVSGVQAEEVSGVRGAMSCHVYNAARLSPYRLITRLLEKTVAHGVNLQTFTPVNEVRTVVPDPGSHSWLVDTPRSSVKTKVVIHATSGYTAALVPEMKDKIVPVRGMVARLAGSKAPRTKDSYMMRFSDYEYDYMIPRLVGSVMLGGGRRDYYKNLDDWFDVSDDSELIEGARGYFDGYMQRHFHGWEDSGSRTKEIWTGAMGYSNDKFPYVDAIPGKPGQYICAGFTGHGMPQIFLSAKAVASMIITGDSENLDLPAPYRTTKER
ncbi:FAD dependent oxidoreductase [Setomelanomma holmii]|uniref:FAD dependent oxidoreductase n=1 Tax=Setomelanomma holmii TaxID=210430 RepID=A0A9P4LLK8_9PLEO|nr:FAD dependent oxidoreductase [Setomelanomma holmii]